jgi:phosphotriesterase-related protein
MIRTVAGDVEGLHGPWLCHEHLQIDLCCQKGPEVVLGDAEQADVASDLQRARQLGLCGVVDLSVHGSGRNPANLLNISCLADLPVVCAAGFYWDPFPAEVLEGSIASLCDTLVREMTQGIGETGVRAGVIKIGTGPGAIDVVAERLFEAAARAALTTGAAVITHTSAVEQAVWHLDALCSAGLPAERILISHMGAAQHVDELLEVARAGSLMGIDKVGFIARRSNAELADLVRDACAAGLAGQLILSSDVARKDRLLRRGGSSYGAVFSDFIPMLHARGVGEEDIEVMMCRNPQRLLHLAEPVPLKASS